MPGVSKKMGALGGSWVLYSENYTPTYHLLRGFRGLTDMIGRRSTQEPPSIGPAREGRHVYINIYRYIRCVCLYSIKGSHVTVYFREAELVQELTFGSTGRREAGSVVEHRLVFRRPRRARHPE